MSGLDIERSIWIEPENLGRSIQLTHRKKRYEVKIPSRIDRKVVIRLRGLGKHGKDQTGDLLLLVLLKKGPDIHKGLWLSETRARIGVKLTLLAGPKKIQVWIPPGSKNGDIITVAGSGKMPEFSWRAPFLHMQRGDLLVRLFVYPDYVLPRYGSFDTLSTDNMAVEGWVYRMYDTVIQKMGAPTFRVNMITADEIADSFNKHGWIGIFYLLAEHLKLARLNIQIEQSDTLTRPGRCHKQITLQNGYPVSASYFIEINSRFLDNPFMIAAILAHELCHVVYSERIQEKSKWVEKSQDLLEEERMVDLLVFMFRIGEFQLRVARDARLTLGYFNQDLFERIYVIVSRKFAQG